LRISDQPIRRSEFPPFELIFNFLDALGGDGIAPEPETPTPSLADGKVVPRVV